MHKLHEYVCEELEQLEKKADKGGLSMSEIELADKLAHLGKNLDKMMESKGEGYSGAMVYDGRGSYRYENGGSYARGRGRNAERDNMGRYSGDGYSRAADDAMESLREAQRRAPDEQTRQEYSRMISRLESM